MVIVVNLILLVVGYSDMVFCVGNLINVVNFIFIFFGVIFGWINFDLFIGLVVNGIGNIFLFIVVNFGSILVIVIIMYVLVLNGCMGLF